MRILPYRTADDKIDGLVMTFTNIDHLKKIEREIKLARDYAESIVATVREPLLVLDGDLRVYTANQAFFREFGFKQRDTVGRLVYNLGAGQWNIPELRKLLEEILPENSSFDDFKVVQQFPNIGTKELILNARRLVDTDHATDESRNLILLSIQDLDK